MGGAGFVRARLAGASAAHAMVMGENDVNEAGYLAIGIMLGGGLAADNYTLIVFAVALAAFAEIKAIYENKES